VCGTGDESAKGFEGLVWVRGIILSWRSHNSKEKMGKRCIRGAGEERRYLTTVYV